MNGVNDYDNFDGPTSAYVKRNRKTSFAYKFKKMLYERKKAEVEKSISFDDNHAIEEVCQYVQEQWGFKEADRNSAEYKFMYKQIKHDINREINLFLYVREDNDAHMDIEIETTTGYIAGGVTGKKSSIKEFNRILRDVFIYYGVMQDDIIEKTKRYKNLVSILMQEA